MIGNEPTIEHLRTKLDEERPGKSPAEWGRCRSRILRQALDESWREILRIHRAGGQGREVVQALSARADGLVRVLFEEAQIDAGREEAAGFAILALGGYGRGTLSPRSDIDLLFLFDKMQENDPITPAVLHTLWDLRFEVGHSTRTIPDCVKIAREDSDSLTSMLEARLIVGDAELAQRLDETLAGQFLGRRTRGFIRRKIEERSKRHARAGLSVQLEEPNVKESPGGLRDTDTVGWILRARGSRSNSQGFVNSSLLTREDYRLYDNAIDFLWRTRNELHFRTGKRFDILEHELQPSIAEGLGFSDDRNELGVERFMKEYYQQARSIRHLTDLVCDRLGDRPPVTHRAVGLITRRVLDDGAVLARDHIGISKRRIGTFFVEDPCRLLRLFLDAQRFGLPLDEPSRRTIKDHLHLINDNFRKSRRSAAIFLEILRAPGGVGEALRSMHELGVLGAYIPEFGGLTCHVQYNRYHIYTADEHTLVAIENLDRLRAADPPDESLQPLKQALSEIGRKELLYVALLLHDVGKALRDQDHSEAGAKMSEAFMSRLGFPDEQIETVSFLIRNHLAMSHIAQRRDLSDRALLRAFADPFRHPDILRMLYVLTYADLSAVARTAWTSWKGQLLWELYSRSFDILTSDGDTAREREPYQAAEELILKTLKDRFSRHTLEEHLHNLPARYSGLNSPEEVETHLRMIEGLGTTPVAVTVEPGGPFSTLTVCTKDKPYRLSEICGVLATNDINIIGAQAYTRSDGFVLDVFRVTRGAPDAEMPAVIKKVEDQLGDVFRGTVSVENLLASHRRRWSRRRKPAYTAPTEIGIENDVSLHYTVIDVFAQDAVGLLYEITHALSELGLYIYTARIGTSVDRAVDSFYVTLGGKKVEDAQEIDRIRTVLMEKLA